MTRAQAKKYAKETIDKYPMGNVDHEQAKTELYAAHKIMVEVGQRDGWGYGVGDLCDDLDNLGTYHWQRTIA